MSRIKELKTNEDYNLNLIELFGVICPEGKSKYIETLIRIMKNIKNYNQYIDDVKRELSNNLDIPTEKLNDIKPLHLLIHYFFLQNIFNFGDLRTFKKFCELNERNLIVQNDLSKYNSFEQIMASVSLADLRVQDKETEKQIIKIHEDDEWLLVRPLTHLASKKYGANTKWCTASESNGEYFFKYSTGGILIYCINKKTGLKVASFKQLPNNSNEESLLAQFFEFSFWNQRDDRIDSLDSGLPSEILQIIVKEIKDNPVTNISLLPDEFKTLILSESKLLYATGSIQIAQNMVQEEVMEPQQQVEVANDVRRTWNGGN